MKTEHAPHTCPICGEAAFVGFNNVECTNLGCRHFHECTWQAHVMALPDPGDPLEFEDTDPLEWLFNPGREVLDDA